MCFWKWKKKYNQLEKDYIKLWTEYQILLKKDKNLTSAINDVKKNKIRVSQIPLEFYPEFKTN